MKKYINILKGVKIPWPLIAVMFGVTTISGQLEVKTVRLTADIIDSSQKAIELNSLLKYVGFLAATVLIAVSNTWLGGITYGKIDKGVRRKVYKHVLRLPSSYYDTKDGKELTSRIISDCGSASVYFEILITTFGAVYTAFLVFKNLLEFNHQLGMYSLLVIPVTCVIAVLYGMITFTAAKNSVNSYAETTSYLFERVGAFRTIKAFNTAEKEKGISKKMFQKMFNAELLSEMAIAFIQVGMQIINCASVIIAFVFGTKLVREGAITIGQLIMFYTLIGAVGVQLINLFLNYGNLASVNGSLNHIAALLDVEEEISEGEKLAENDSDIIFKNVSFTYDKKNVLSDVNFTIEKNKVTAIIGTNGAGKSTVFKLIQRMYSPTSGNIYFGDKDVAGYDLKDWRDNFAVVSQNSQLISGTIRENMCYGAKEQVSDEKLIEIAKACGIYDYILSQEKGFDSEISIGSSNLSGGQKQAMSIARAILKDSRYLLLDEATKSLDATSENIVEKALSVLMKGRTTIMIAHNPSAIVNADNIIVMKDGKVDDFGTPEELIKRNEYYKTFMKIGE